ncbi:MAG: RNA 2',3'-cyclic phosphodiesterase [Chloroflexota bacterium]|nr:RNA 2',3'-cyclic phosphodiesterase [Chloroflexota bacterium]
MPETETEPPGPRAGAGRSSRLFIAVVPPPAVRAALAATQEALRAGLAAPGAEVRLRWVRPEAIHLTLRFLGETPDAQRPAIERALAATATAGAPIDLRLGAVGTFGGRRPRVVWVGLEGDVAALGDRASALNRALAAEGFPDEPRPLRPHLTLARVSGRPGRDAHARLLSLVAAAPAPGPAAFRVGALELIRSELRPDGPRYTILARAPLGGAS